MEFTEVELLFLSALAGEKPSKDREALQLSVEVTTTEYSLIVQQKRGRLFQFLHFSLIFVQAGRDTGVLCRLLNIFNNIQYYYLVQNDVLCHVGSSQGRLLKSLFAINFR